MTDWSREITGLLVGCYADCGKITLVPGNLKTHTKGTFYEALEPARLRELLCRIDFRKAPKHGSRLNIVENELSAMPPNA